MGSFTEGMRLGQQAVQLGIDNRLRREQADRESEKWGFEKSRLERDQRMQQLDDEENFRAAGLQVPGTFTPKEQMAMGDGPASTGLPEQDTSLKPMSAKQYAEFTRVMAMRKGETKGAAEAEARING